MLTSLLVLALAVAPLDAPLRTGVTQLATDTPEGAALVETRTSIHSARRTLQFLTVATLAGVSVMGTLLAINKPTAFGNGRCASGDPIFGAYGCDGYSILHGAGGVLAVTSYTAAEVVGVIDRAENPVPRSGVNLGLSYTHLVGMVLQPLLGLIGAYPQVVGVTPAGRESFSRGIRTVHVALGYVVTLAYLGAMLTE